MCTYFHLQGSYVYCLSLLATEVLSASNLSSSRCGHDGLPFFQWRAENGWLMMQYPLGFCVEVAAKKNNNTQTNKLWRLALTGRSVDGSKTGCDGITFTRSRLQHSADLSWQLIIFSDIIKHTSVSRSSVQEKTKTLIFFFFLFFFLSFQSPSSRPHPPTPPKKKNFRVLSVLAMAYSSSCVDPLNKTGHLLIVTDD